MKRYRKQAKIAMAVALAATSLGNTIPALSAQEGQVQENNIDKKDETSEVENLPEIEKLPTVEDEEQKEADSEIKDVVEEIATTENTQIKNEEGNSSVEKRGEEIILNEQYFPDAGFREFIKRECSINDNEVLTEEKRNQVISINVSGTENNLRTDLRSLEGIQYFPNLKQLYCNYQTELTGTLNLSENTKLELIYAWNTKLTGLNINGLTSLTRFDISSNPQLVGEFDLRENSELEWMNAHTTQISNVNVTGLAKLKMFSVANTNVSGELDFTGNTALEELIVRNTRVTSINIQGLTNLINLHIDSNPNLTGEFDLSRNPNLSICHAWGTRITRLNVDGLTNLTSFSVSQNPNLVGDFDLS
ncbi:MAG: hypothetical protein K2F55_02835, partial [Erysipelotrichaceae bacterium]|nr:hypothetical protein [Erysipelotrichaceae bacterium]